MTESTKGELATYAMLASIASIPSGIVGFLDGSGTPVNPVVRIAALAGPVAFNGGYAYGLGVIARGIGRHFDVTQTKYYREGTSDDQERLRRGSKNFKNLQPSVGLSSMSKNTSLVSIVSYSIGCGIGVAWRFF